MTLQEQLQKLKAEYELLLNSGDIFTDSKTDGVTGASIKYRKLEEVHSEIEYIENLIAQETSPRRAMRIKFYAN